MKTVIRKLPISIAAIVFLAPFYIAFVYSFKTRAEVAAASLSFPKKLYLENFRRIYTENPAFKSGLINSTITTIPIVITLTVICSMASYSIARNNKKFYNMIITL